MMAYYPSREIRTWSIVVCVGRRERKAGLRLATKFDSILITVFILATSRCGAVCRRYAFGTGGADPEPDANRLLKKDFEEYLSSNSSMRGSSTFPQLDESARKTRPFGHKRSDGGLFQRPALKGTGAAGAATVGEAGVEIAQEVLTEAQGGILPLVPYLDTLRWVFGALALGGIGIAVWARVDDWKKGRR